MSAETYPSLGNEYDVVYGCCLTVVSGVPTGVKSSTDCVHEGDLICPSVELPGLMLAVLFKRNCVDLRDHDR